jgi:hypothetical protein
MKEIWKDIKGFEGKYQISNIGRVKSIRISPKNKKGNLIMKTNKDSRGYNCIGLWKDFDNKLKKQNRPYKLVAIHFLENPNNYKCVNHKDGNKLNDNVNNLEWCSHSQNIKHAWDNNLTRGNTGKICKKHKGKKDKRTKLVKDDILYILKSKNTIKNLSIKFNVSFVTIYLIKKRKLWRDINIKTN